MNKKAKIAIGIAGVAALASIIYFTKKKSGLNVKTVGAVGDGLTNDTDAIQKAIDYSEEIYIPKGKYLIDNLKLKSGTSISGDGIGQTILIHTANPKGNGCMISAMSESTDSKLSSLKLSNLTLEGQSEKSGFSEFVHLLYLIGVENVSINNILFRAFQGDAINLGGVCLSDSTTRHNKNVIIKNCKFDGINRANRNAIKISDCTNLLIEKCKIVNTTQKNMPSAIDFEPDAKENIISKCSVNGCYFQNVGGDLGVVGINIANFDFVQYPNNITISNNTIRDCSNDMVFSYQYAKEGGISENEASASIVIENNKVSGCQSPFFLSNINNIAIVGNKFYDCDRAAIISYPSFGGEVGRNILIQLNDFVRVGQISGSGIIIFNAEKLVIDKNNFLDCGSGKNGMDYAINFNTGESKNVIIKNNNFDSVQEKTKQAIHREKNHKFDDETNEFYHNKLNGLLTDFKYAVNYANN